MKLIFWLLTNIKCFVKLKLLFQVCVCVCVCDQVRPKVVYQRATQHTFQSKFEKLKKFPKKFLIFQETELSSSNIEKFLYLFKKKQPFLVLPEMEPCFFEPKFVMLQETETANVFLIFQKRETPKKFLIFQETLF